MYSMIHQSNFW